MHDLAKNIFAVPERFVRVLSGGDVAEDDVDQIVISCPKSD
jgi:hypothetical protein